MQNEKKNSGWKSDTIQGGGVTDKKWNGPIGIAIAIYIKQPNK